MEQCPRRGFPPQNRSGVVQERVTSRQEQSGESVPERCGMRNPPALREAVVQTKRREPMVPTGKGYRDGEGQVFRLSTKRGRQLRGLFHLFLPVQKRSKEAVKMKNAEKSTARNGRATGLRLNFAVATKSLGPEGPSCNGARLDVV